VTGVDSPVLYIKGEAFLAAGLVVNLVLLVLAGRLARLSPAYGRCAAAALGGAILSLWTVTRPPSPGAPTAIAVLVGAFGMVLAAYFPAPWRRLGAATAALIAGAMLLGGAVVAISLISGPGGAAAGSVPVPVPWKWVAASLGACALGIGLLGAYRRGRATAQWCLPAELEVEGRRTRLLALIDTGNRLADPFTGAPVMVVELGAVGQLLPGEVRELCRDPRAALNGPTSAWPDEWARRFRVVPFTTVGKTDGLMVGFRADRLTVYRSRGGPVTSDHAVFCVYSGSLSHGGAYQALLPPELAGEEGEVA
jgi:stage II sporulation protein GA (sporulation sigma-E factor processing peptidase)